MLKKKKKRRQPCLSSFSSHLSFLTMTGNYRNCCWIPSTVSSCLCEKKQFICSYEGGSLQSIACTFIIFSTISGSNFLLFIFVQVFYRVMLIFFDHRNGSALSLHRPAFTLPFQPWCYLPDSRSPCNCWHKFLSTFFGSFEICYCEETLGPCVTMMGYGPYRYTCLF